MDSARDILKMKRGDRGVKEKCYICCDLKSFYASVECVERGLDPMTTNLVVADKRRTDKTICLAVTPSLKAYGISVLAITQDGSFVFRVIVTYKLSSSFFQYDPVTCLYG